MKYEERRLRTLANRLKEARVKKGLSHDGLARIAATAKQTIVNIENGTHVPSLRILYSVADALEVTLADLLAA